MVNLNTLSNQCYNIAELREKNGANISTQTNQTLKHCATEVIEAMEAYNIWQEELKYSGIGIGVTDPGFQIDYKKEFEYELADIICCVLSVCGKYNIDIETVLQEKINKNDLRAEMKGDKL